MSDIWSLLPSTQASDATDPPPENAGSSRPPGSSCPGREPPEEVAPVPTGDCGTGAAAASTFCLLYTSDAADDM
eukprot:7519772-Alexandrium_andersonii.AAC.1